MVYMRAFVFFCFAIVFMLSSLCGAEASGQASSGAEVDASVPSCDASAGLANPGMYPYDNQLRLAWNLSEWIEGIKSGTGRGTDASKPDRLVASLDGKTLFHVCVGEKYGFIDKQGRMVINPQFDMALDFSEGLACVGVGSDEKTRKYGFIDKQGRMVINPQFDMALNFSEGLACVGVDEKTRKHGFIDKQGRMVINPQFDWADSFSEGLAQVGFGNDLKASKWGFIDKQGRMVINPQFDMALGFSEGLAKVGFGDWMAWKFGYIDKQGRMVWDPLKGMEGSGQASGKKS